MKTDNDLRADVEAELNWEPSLDNRGIIIAAKDGVVTLGGYVTTYTDKWAAERAAKSVAGVRAIANDIEVKPMATAVRADKDIAAAAVTALKSNVSVPANDIKVIVREGWITLEGKATLWYQKSAAEAAVRNLWGVKGIINNIELRPAVHVGDVRGRIHQTFKRHADLDADKIHVEALDGTVKLTGTVRSWHERDDAETAAWSAPGVIHVKNDLSISI